MTKPKVLVTDFIKEPLDLERQILGDLAEVVTLQAESTEHLADLLTDAQALLVFHFVRITEAMMDRMPSLKLIVRCGAGYDNIDWRAARGRGIDVANVPDYGTEDVADTAIAMLLSLARGTHRWLCRFSELGDKCWASSGWAISVRLPLCEPKRWVTMWSSMILTRGTVKTRRWAFVGQRVCRSCVDNPTR
jgi:lactate dehydrogenase-like 2-hydroxyacid dehydrogenase